MESATLTERPDTWPKSRDNVEGLSVTEEAGPTLVVVVLFPPPQPEIISSGAMRMTSQRKEPKRI